MTGERKDADLLATTQKLQWEYFVFWQQSWQRRKLNENSFRFWTWTEQLNRCENARITCLKTSYKQVWRTANALLTQNARNLPSLNGDIRMGQWTNNDQECKNCNSCRGDSIWCNNWTWYCCNRLKMACIATRSQLNIIVCTTVIVSKHPCNPSRL